MMELKQPRPRKEKGLVAGSLDPAQRAFLATKIG